LIVDSSALLALVLEEDEAPRISRALAVNDCAMSAPTYFEASLVVQRKKGTEATKAMRALIASSGIRVLPFDEPLAQIASDAYAKFGKGSGHKAGLNFGDCFSYALAKQRDEPLLAVGPEFADVGLPRG
jgi:ribonuclease VapC